MRLRRDYWNYESGAPLPRQLTLSPYQVLLFKESIQFFSNPSKECMLKSLYRPLRVRRPGGCLHSGAQLPGAALRLPDQRCSEGKGREARGQSPRGLALREYRLGARSAGKNRLRHDPADFQGGHRSLKGIRHHNLERGCRRLILGLGGSATNDLGAGAAAAMGVRFTDSSGREFQGPAAERVIRLPPAAARKASTLPSPPSATGI